jgi:hypothetical protein
VRSSFQRKYNPRICSVPTRQSPSNRPLPVRRGYGHLRQQSKSAFRYHDGLQERRVTSQRRRRSLWRRWNGVNPQFGAAALPDCVDNRAVFSVYPKSFTLSFCSSSLSRKSISCSHAVHATACPATCTTADVLMDGCVSVKLGLTA